MLKDEVGYSERLNKYRQKKKKGHHRIYVPGKKSPNKNLCENLDKDSNKLARGNEK